jgi:hypothetical protein
MVFVLKNRLIAMIMTHALWIVATEQRAVCTRKSVIATVARAQMTALHLLMLAQSRSARMVHVASSQRFAMTKTFAPRIHAWLNWADASLNPSLIAGHALLVLTLNVTMETCAQQTHARLFQALQTSASMSRRYAMTIINAQKMFATHRQACALTIQ